MDREELRDEVRGIVHRDSNSMSNAIINTRINWAQRDICELHTFEELKDIYEGVGMEADEALYNFPSAMKELVAIYIYEDNDERKLDYMPTRRFALEHPYPPGDTTGTPELYVDRGDFFEVWRVPDDDYLLRCVCACYAAVLDDDTSESELVEKDQVIIARAAAYCFQLVRELEDSEYWNSQFAQLMRVKMSGDHSAVDWDPIARPHTTARVSWDHRNPWVGLRTR